MVEKKSIPCTFCFGDTVLKIFWTVFLYGQRKENKHMADAKSEKQKVKEITDKLEEAPCGGIGVLSCPYVLLFIV